MDVFIGFAMGVVTTWACVKLLQWDKEAIKKNEKEDDVDKGSGKTP